METEKFELMLDEAQANAALEKGMLYADTFVNKNYLINLDRYPLVELDSAEKSDEYIRLYQIGKPVVLKNAEGDLTTPSAVFFETQTDVTVGSAAKESAKMYPEQVVTFIKRSIGQPGFSLNLNGIDMKPEEISSYILKKVVIKKVHPYEEPVINVIPIWRTSF